LRRDRKIVFPFMANRASLIPLLFLAGCAGQGMVRIPKSDATPPSAELEARGDAAPIRLGVGGEARRVELRQGDSLVLTGSAEDRGGIKDMVLQGNALVTCSDPSTGASYTRLTGFARRHVPGSASIGRAAPRRDSRFVLRAADFERLCPGGRLGGAVGQARVQAANYHGGASSSPHLEFRIAASEVAAQAIPMPVAVQPARAGDPTGFAPLGGLGGNGTLTGTMTGTMTDAGPAAAGRTGAALAPRMCPRSAKPGHAAETRPSDPIPECLDTPVPSMSPSAPAGAPALRPAPAIRSAPARGRDRRTSRLGIGAQKPQIRTLPASGI
jgi:hypothetical protein